MTYLYRPRTAGFTLSEMLVVLAIIALLLAVVIASFGKARTTTNNKSEIDRVQSIGLDLKLYREHTGHYPPGQASFALNQTEWNAIAAALAGAGIVPQASIADDTWGHAYAYANTSGHYVTLCSGGPNGVLETTDSYALSNTNPQVPSGSDDVCYFTR